MTLFRSLIRATGQSRTFMTWAVEAHPDSTPAPSDLDSDSLTVMGLNGSLDANTQSELEAKAKAAIDSGAEYLLPDMSAVDYLGSAGMRGIHANGNLLSPDDPSMRSSHLKVVNPSPAAAKIFKTLGFDSFIDIHGSVDEAIAAL